MQKSNSHVHLDYASAQSSLHVLCKPYSIMMLYMKELSASARIHLDNSIFMKLQVGSSMRDFTMSCMWLKVMSHIFERRYCAIFELVVVVDHKCSQMHKSEYLSKLSH
jgi:hypothetical protein